MAKQEEHETERFHAVLFKKDLEWLRQNYGPGSAKEDFGISRFIRVVVEQRINGLKAKEIGALDGLKTVEATGDKR